MSEAPARAGDEWGCVLLDLSAYLRRIGYDGDLALTGRALAGLHRAHIAAIPFENGDIMLGRGVAVDLPSVAGKLVHRCRGGYCFEHGLLLAAALERLSDAEFADALTEIFGLQFSDAEAARLTAITRDTDAGDLPGSRT